MRILALGDVTGSEAVDYVTRRLRAFKRENKIDLTVVNGENSAKGNGIDAYAADALLNGGADVITTGNHVFRINAFSEYLEESRSVIRPENYPKGCPGVGYTILDCGFERVLVMNVLGRTYMEPVNCPFEAVEEILKKEQGNFSVSVLDVHAEATSEKAAIAQYFDGRISAVFGTHTHVQTNDARVLPCGTGFITDLGMCGPVNTILGVDSEAILRNMRHKLPTRFVTADGPCRAMGAIFETDASTGKCTKVSRVEF